MERMNERQLVLLVVVLLLKSAVVARETRKGQACQALALRKNEKSPAIPFPTESDLDIRFFSKSPNSLEGVKLELVSKDEPSTTYLLTIKDNQLNHSNGICSNPVHGFAIMLAKGNGKGLNLTIHGGAGTTTGCYVPQVDLGDDEFDLRIQNIHSSEKVLVFNCRECSIFSDDDQDMIEENFEKTQAATKSNVSNAWFVHCENKKGKFGCHESYLKEYKLTFDVTSSVLELLKENGEVPRTQNGSQILWKKGMDISGTKTQFSWFDDNCTVVYQEPEEPDQGGSDGSVKEETCSYSGTDLLTFCLGWAVFLLALVLLLCKMIMARKVQKKRNKGLGSDRDVQAVVRFSNSSSPTVTLPCSLSGGSCGRSSATHFNPLDQKASGDKTFGEKKTPMNNIKNLNLTMSMDDHKKISSDKLKPLPTSAYPKTPDEGMGYGQLPRPRFASVEMQKDLREDPEEENAYDDPTEILQKQLSSAPGPSSGNGDSVNNTLPLSQYECENSIYNVDFR